MGLTLFRLILKVGLPLPFTSLTHDKHFFCSPQSGLLQNGRAYSEGLSLDLHSVARQDAGIYVCTATNSVGSAEAEIEVDIKCKYISSLLIRNRQRRGFFDLRAAFLLFFSVLCVFSRLEPIWIRRLFSPKRGETEAKSGKSFGLVRGAKVFYTRLRRVGQLAQRNPIFAAFFASPWVRFEGENRRLPRNWGFLSFSLSLIYSGYIAWEKMKEKFAKQGEKGALSDYTLLSHLNRTISSKNEAKS